MPERRACDDLEESDPMAHKPEYSERVLDTVGQLLRRLCPSCLLIRYGCYKPMGRGGGGGAAHVGAVRGRRTPSHV